jgi:hypothetical protein
MRERTPAAHRKLVRWFSLSPAPDCPFPQVDLRNLDTVCIAHDEERGARPCLPAFKPRDRFLIDTEVSRNPRLADPCLNARLPSDHAEVV